MARKLKQADAIRLIRIAVYSVGDTITADEALSVIASCLPAEDPGPRIDRAKLPELLALIAEGPRRRRPS